MAQVSPRITLADATVAGWIERALVLRIPGLLDRKFAFGGEQQSMAGGAGGKHAIHHVDARLSVMGDLFRSANPHQIARLVLGKMLKRGQDHVLRKLARFADAQPAAGVAGTTNVDQSTR